MENPDQATMTMTRHHFGRELLSRQLNIYRAEWDLEAEPAADPTAAITALITNQIEFHGIAQQPELAAALAAAAPDDHEAAELKRLQAQAAGIPLELVQQAVGAALQSLQAWHAARAANDFSLVAEPFAQLIAIQRGMAQVKAANLSQLYGRTVSPYEALIDGYDPGRRLDFIKAEFGKLVPVCQELLKKEQPAGTLLAGRTFDIELQAQLSAEIVAAMGYDAAPPRGKLGVSAHPFCRRVGPDAVWLTNRYTETELLPALITIVHEGAHGCYYQGLPQDKAHDWMGMIASESLNEGMALLAEHLLARRPAFARYLAPKINRAFGIELSADDLYRELVRVERSPIRAEAAEVIYPLHLVLRTEIEEALINGDLDPRALPAFWNKRSTELMGITPRSDAEGCLQDIQLFAGYIGYFPCYLLGHMAAAQLWPAIERDLPELDDQIAEGDFAALKGWLEKHVYQHSRTKAGDSLIHAASGQDFSADALIAHLKARYA